jgi:hypothetical protein
MISPAAEKPAGFATSAACPGRPLCFNPGVCGIGAKGTGKGVPGTTGIADGVTIPERLLSA